LITVVGVLGKEVYNSKVNYNGTSSETIVDIADQKNGLYYMIVETDDAQLFTKIVLAK
jgi:hypothetical protein